MSLTICSIEAYSAQEALYVLDAQDGHYAFRYDQIAPHFSTKVRKQVAKPRKVEKATSS